jgi:hypothetical protein
MDNDDDDDGGMQIATWVTWAVGTVRNAVALQRIIVACVRSSAA